MGGRLLGSREKASSAPARPPLPDPIPEARPAGHKGAGVSRARRGNLRAMLGSLFLEQK